MKESRALRPLDNLEIANEAFHLYKSNFILFTGISGIVEVPYALALALTASAPAVNDAVLWGSVLPATFASGALARAVADRYLGRKVTIAEAWSHVLRRWFPYLATSLMWILSCLGGLLLCLAPGIILFFWSSFVSEVAIIEDRYYRAALRRSRELAAGQWGRIFVVGLVTMGLIFAIEPLIDWMKGALQEWLGRSTGTADSRTGPLWMPVLQGLLGSFVRVIVSSLTSLAWILLYFDLRVRKEGLDIELLAQDMGAGTINGGPSPAPA